MFPGSQHPYELRIGLVHAAMCTCHDRGKRLTASCSFDNANKSFHRGFNAVFSKVRRR